MGKSTISIGIFKFANCECHYQRVKCHENSMVGIYLVDPSIWKIRSWPTVLGGTSGLSRCEFQRPPPADVFGTWMTDDGPRAEDTWRILTNNVWLVVLYMVIIWLLYGYYMVIIWLLYGYCMVIIWLLYGYYMVNMVIIWLLCWLLYG